MIAQQFYYSRGWENFLVVIFALLRVVGAMGTMLAFSSSKSHFSEALQNSANCVCLLVSGKGSVLGTGVLLRLPQTTNTMSVAVVVTSYSCIAEVHRHPTMMASDSIHATFATGTVMVALVNINVPTNLAFLRIEPSERSELLCAAVDLPHNLNIASNSEDMAKHLVCVHDECIVLGWSDVKSGLQFSKGHVTTIRAFAQFQHNANLSTNVCEYLGMPVFNPDGQLKGIHCNSWNHDVMPSFMIITALANISLSKPFWTRLYEILEWRYRHDVEDTLDLQAASNSSPTPCDVVDLIANSVTHSHWPILLTGPVGSGKTTVLQKLCRVLFSKLQDQPALVPIYIDMASVDVNKDKRGHLGSIICSAIELQLQGYGFDPDEIFHIRNRSVFLLDNFDVYLRRPFTFDDLSAIEGWQRDRIVIAIQSSKTDCDSKVSNHLRLCELSQDQVRKYVTDAGEQSQTLLNNHSLLLPLLQASPCMLASFKTAANNASTPIIGVFQIIHEMMKIYFDWQHTKVNQNNPFQNHPFQTIDIALMREFSWTLALWMSEVGTYRVFHANKGKKIRFGDDLVDKCSNSGMHKVMKVLSSASYIYQDKKEDNDIAMIVSTCPLKSSLVRDNEEFEFFHPLLQDFFVAQFTCALLVLPKETEILFREFPWSQDARETTVSMVLPRVWRACKADFLGDYLLHRIKGDAERRYYVVENLQWLSGTATDEKLSSMLHTLSNL